ncbi:long-chain-acyl-CoA synthetase [Methyloferula stellata]|uniref:long-chain-acyl-CoA synthetase n=1 Tax=Methyloferula stellata TaxID=876270 RepID=UPI0012694BF4|nr:long-chain-acyl-CoA synthetase [Methyloferula stellata]
MRVDASRKEHQARKWIMRLLERVRRELRYFFGLVRILRAVHPVATEKTKTVGQVIENLAEKYGDKTALVSTRETLSYRELNARANLYARWARAQGFGPGDTIALLMPNRPEYFCVWMGLAKAGCVTALINTNLIGPALAQCINVAHPRAIIVDACLLASLEAVRTLLGDDTRIFLHGEAAGAGAIPRVDSALGQFSGENLPAAERPIINSKDRCLYIYTSGTTGLPKAANLNHFRVLLMMIGFAGLTAAKPTDRVYNCLPMYHSVGGIAAFGAGLIKGGTLIIREKFSAREFWSDIVRYDCNIFCYVGELCRYLLAAPPCPEETAHHLRLCCGNGLRPDVWMKFSERFHVPRILEYYAATEGNVALFNFDSTPGAVGRLPDWIKHRFPIAIVRYDIETEQPVRGANGFCIACAPGEPGEIIGEIMNDPKKPANRFEGYSDKAASERKILRNVFKSGDAWFATGDLMMRDARGYYYFLDRAGDTFRWKGENVSTTQVSEAITAFSDITEANVYGVSIPGTEGRAGMAAIVVKDMSAFDLETFRQHLQENLPHFARPLFLRFQNHLDITSTFKPRKMDLVAQGFDPTRSTDSIFFDDPEAGTFVPVDPVLHEHITQGRRRL